MDYLGLIYIITFFVVFQLKHFICDYLLQTQYMLGKMNTTNWQLPLAAHAAVHGFATLVILFIMLLVLGYVPFEAFILWLALLDFIAHFCIDRLKASPSLGGRYNPTQTQFWTILGLDQMTHHLCHYFYIFYFLVAVTSR